MKRCKLLLAALLLMIMPFFGLKSVKAESIHPGISRGSVTDYSGNNNVGSYVYDQISSNGNGDYIDLSPYGIISGFNCLYGIVIHVSLNGYYTGAINIDFGQNIMNWYDVIYVDGDGVAAWNTTNSSKRLIIPLTDCKNFDVYMFSTYDPVSANVNIQPTGFFLSESSYLSSINDVVARIADYQLPWYQLTAYAMATQNTDQIQYSDGDIAPYVVITSGSRSKTISVNAGSQKHFIFIASVNLTSSSITSSNQSVSLTYSPVQSYTFGGGYRMYDLTLTLSSGQSANVYFNYATNFNMIPIFYGTSTQMPDDVYAVVMNQHVYEQTLSRILQQLIALAGNTPPADQDTDLQDDVSDSIGGINVIQSDFISQFQDSFGDIDLNNYSISSSLSRTVGWLTLNMQNIFARSGDFSILFTLPLVLGLALFFIGRGAVIFRQGNIDRAEDRHNWANYAANAHADYLEGRKEASRSTEVAYHKLTHERLRKK